MFQFCIISRNYFNYFNSLTLGKVSQNPQSHWWLVLCPGFLRSPSMMMLTFSKHLCGYPKTPQQELQKTSEPNKPSHQEIYIPKKQHLTSTPRKKKKRLPMTTSPLKLTNRPWEMVVGKQTSLLSFWEDIFFRCQLLVLGRGNNHKTYPKPLIASYLKICLSPQKRKFIFQPPTIDVQVPKKNCIFRGEKIPNLVGGFNPSEKY